MNPNDPSYVVRKVAPGRPTWPLWVGLAVLVVGLVVGTGRAVLAFQQVLPSASRRAGGAAPAGTAPPVRR